MAAFATLPNPHIDALLFGAHRRIPVDTDQGLFEACGVRIAFTGREGGTSEGAFASLNLAGHVGDDPERVARNRNLVFSALGCEGMPVIIGNQVHGAHVVRIGGADESEAAQAQADEGADAFVVDGRGVAAMVNVGDCLPLVIVAPSGRFAVVHAGWRGAVAGIAGKAARMLAEGPETEDPAGFNAYIGPHIRCECFEVGEEVVEAFVDAFGASVVPAVRHVDLARAVTCDLAKAGMNPERIADVGICTVCNAERYFSYRASGGVCGRQTALAFR